VKEHMPDLLILDAMLPELHGFDIARRLRGSEKYGAIPIIMISAVYRGWRVAEDLKASYGIQDYLEKPFRITDVVNAATRALLPQTPEPTKAPDRDPEALSGEAEKALNDGIAAYREGAIDKAIELLKSGIQIDPLAYRLHFHLALLFGKKGLVFDGIGELEKAIELNPKHFPALKNLAVLYEKAGFKHRAVEMWERCVHASPDTETRAQIKEHLIRLL
jgi:DNA-binding response OmpR family regulator